MSKVVLLQTTIPDFRQGVLDLLVGELGDEFHVFAGREYFEATVKTRVSLGSHSSLVKNHFLRNRSLLFQSGMLLPVLKAEVAILELNPRILSNWLLLLVRKVLGKKSVLWGHAWPRGGKHKRSDRVRHLMRRLGDIIVVYTKTQREELIEKMSYKKVIVAPNALYSKKVMGADPDLSRPKNFIYVGRLVAPKKPVLLLEAFAQAVERLPADCNLVYVGDGPLRAELEARSQELGLQTRVRFEGHLSEVEKLRELYGSSIASVSPGYVGLSIIQSFGFGVPMIIARDEPHAPEIEAAVEGVNSCMFASDSSSDLSKILTSFVDDKELWAGRRASIASECARRYSVEVMASRILKAVSEA